MKLIFTPLIFLLISFSACLENEPNTMQNPPDPQFDKYWYNGEAEITSYELKQARYGEVHEGKAVLIFVTEPFSKSSMTKADNPGKDDPSVLKLNFTKNFNTGIYPYSMMTSTFLPVKDPKHSLKVSSSSQEWCGHTFMELNNRSKFEINTASYFQSDQSGIMKLDKDILEDDIWSMIRINPKSLPTGKTKMIPSFFYLRLGHIPTQAYDVELAFKKNEDGSSTYTALYPSIERSIAITFDSNFPHQITSWEENAYSGFGSKRKKLVTTGTKINTIKSDYWSKHNKKDMVLRKELGLE